MILRLHPSRLCGSVTAVSYTHLDVYKRQAIDGRVPLPAAVPSTVASYRLLWKKSSGPCPLMAPV